MVEGKEQAGYPGKGVKGAGKGPDPLSLVSSVKEETPKEQQEATDMF